jgi:hypothetical protein
MTTGIETSRNPSFKRLGLGFLVGIAASVLPLLSTPRGEPRLFLLWILALLVASYGLGVINTWRPWVWGLSVGLALPFVVMVRIVVDTIRLAGGAVWPATEEHTLFPFELLFAFVIGLSASFIGAYLGSFTRRLARSTSADSESGES